MMLSLISAAALGIGLASAHGYVDNATIGGQYYQFYQDPYYATPPERISRPISGNGPVEDVTIADVQCGGYSAGGMVGSQPAALHAPAAAGSSATLRWTLWPDSHVGSTLTYMSRCPDFGCDGWMPGTEPVWFKIKEDGRTGTSNTWGTTQLMTPGADYQYTIPACLKSGFYLVRHEIIALHAAYKYPGAQFYPGCHQIEVTGAGGTVPPDLVSFPGAYRGSDVGITYDSYKPSPYTVPGPTVFSC